MEHWRVVCRRHYFTSRPALDRTHGFLQLYTFDQRTMATLTAANAGPPNILPGGRQPACAEAGPADAIARRVWRIRTRRMRKLLVERLAIP
jgi:hypothetical protein